VSRRRACPYHTGHSGYCELYVRNFPELIFVRKMYHTARCAMANTMTTEEKAATTQTQSGSQLSL
jgi:hypothetical protein